MHRWLIAIFALHFVLNVSAFSLGGAAPRDTELATANAASSPPPAVKSYGEAHAAKPAPLPFAHGLMDELPDLPDTLSLLVPAFKQPVEPGRATRFRVVRRGPPMLDTPLRPPQATRT
jgi:hypothetical protein